MAGVKGRSGGARVGSGPKRRDPAANWLSGHETKRPASLAVRAEAVAVAVDVPSPVDTAADEAAVWRELAPHATAAGTLRPDTALAFGWFCRTVVMERKLSHGALTAAGPDHRGLMQRMEAGLARFRLIPDGKPVQVVEPKDEWQEFDAPLTVVQGGKS